LSPDKYYYLLTLISSAMSSNNTVRSLLIINYIGAFVVNMGASIAGSCIISDRD